jgi:hypothetical protein
MSKNKLIPKKVKNPNGRKTWMKVAKKVHELNKKEKLGWTWSESMRFASKKVYPKFKGQAHTKVKLSDITSEFKGNLDDFGKIPIPTPKSKFKEICDDVRQIPKDDLLMQHDWYLIAEDDIWNIFTPNMPIRFAFDGIIDTGIIKKSSMPDMKRIREDMRKLYGNVSDPMPQFIFKLLVQPNKKDDDQPCSYYVLITMEGDSYDNLEDREVETNKKLSPEERQKREEEKKEVKKTKKQAKNRLRPKEVEPKSITKPIEKKTEGSPDLEIQKIKLQKENREVLERVLEGLRQDFKDGILTKREYKKRQQQILDKFEKGGLV